jgi:hypothetical protein
MDILSSTIAAIRTGSPSSGLFVRHAPWGRRYPVVPGAEQGDVCFWDTAPLSHVGRSRTLSF